MKDLKNPTFVSIDSIQEHKRAMHLKIEAAKDNIPVYFIRVAGVMNYRVIKTWYKTFEGALNNVQSLQAQIAPSSEVRS